MIVGGGTLLATGLCWSRCRESCGGRSRARGSRSARSGSPSVGLAVFYVSLIGNGLAMGRLVEHGWDVPGREGAHGQVVQGADRHGRGGDGPRLLVLRGERAPDDLPVAARPRPKPQWHLWKFFATGAAALTVGTVQGVIQVQPANADWLYKAGHAGEWIDPISHAHINLVTGLAMLVAGSLFAFVRRLGGVEPSRRLVNTCFFALLGGSLAFYFSALYLGFHEGALVVHRGLTPEAGGGGDRAAPVPDHGLRGSRCSARSGCCSRSLVRSVWRAQSRLRPFVLAGCAALAVGTLQGPVQAVPLVNEALDRGGEAGDVIVNLHAQLNMLAGLMLLLIGIALGSLELLGASWRARPARCARARPGRDGRVLRRRASRSRPSRRTGSKAGARSRQRSRRASRGRRSSSCRRRSPCSQASAPSPSRSGR